MNLLIVDDEEITREGIIEKLPWSKLGISQIQQADDGINALGIVERFNPDIVLADVRMPRMDGIQMATELKKLYPNCTIIFMSGYSDKDYLKSAIHLRAVDYIDKPIKIQELKSAVENAVVQTKRFQVLDQSERAAETYKKVGIQMLRSELALSLIDKNIDTRQAVERAKAADINLPIDGLFVTVIIKLVLCENNTSDQLSSIKASVFCLIENAYLNHRVSGLSAYKNDEYLILHLFASSFQKHIFTEDKLRNFLRDITLTLEGLCKFVISVGRIVQDLNNINDSYKTARSGIERAFFSGYNNILFSERISNRKHGLENKHIKNFIELVDAERVEESIFFIKSFISNLSSYENTPVNDIKNFFYSLLLELCKLAHQKNFDLFDGNTGENYIWEMFLKFYTLSEIEEFIIEKLNTYFVTSKRKSKNSNLIDKIYQYVQRYYSDPDLSIDKIGEYTHFASTYICSVFKERTGKTLNQYITEYRIEKSKEFLKDQDIKVSDIALRVGCRDSGYFTKLFRKATGITPSEYRENLLL